MASKEIGLEVNVDKTKYVVMSRDQNAGQSHSTKLLIVPLKGWKSSNISEQLRGRTIKFVNSPPCACRGSTGQKP